MLTPCLESYILKLLKLNHWKQGWKQCIDFIHSFMQLTALFQPDCAYDS